MGKYSEDQVSAETLTWVKELQVRFSDLKGVVFLSPLLSCLADDACRECSVLPARLLRLCEGNALRQLPTTEEV